MLPADFHKRATITSISNSQMFLAGNLRQLEAQWREGLVETVKVRCSLLKGGCLRWITDLEHPLNFQASSFRRHPVSSGAT